MHRTLLPLVEEPMGPTAGKTQNDLLSTSQTGAAPVAQLEVPVWIRAEAAGLVGLTPHDLRQTRNGRP